MKEGTQIRLLVALAAVFAAFILGYNLFFVREPAETVIVTDLEQMVSETVSSTVSEAEPISETKINLNTATKEELKSLYRIGDVLAQRILDYRETNGKFSSVEELLNVSGIGEKILEAIRDRVEV